ncbi:MAG: hypothetical protein WAM72_12830, partial [Xanthobacteraceae bacterium]
CEGSCSNGSDFHTLSLQIGLMRTFRQRSGEHSNNIKILHGMPPVEFAHTVSLAVRTKLYEFDRVVRFG